MIAKFSRRGERSFDFNPNFGFKIIFFTFVHLLNHSLALVIRRSDQNIRATAKST